MFTACDSYGPITGARLRAAGITAIGRYLTLPGTSKGVTPSELATLMAWGIHVWFGWEIETDDVTGGYAQGVQYAQWANQALATLGLPLSQPVYFAVDETVEPTVPVPYFQGVASVRPPETNGVYGSGAVEARLFALGLATYGWQAGSSGWLTNTATLEETAIQQGTPTDGPLPDTDPDTILKSDFGQYPRPEQETRMITMTALGTQVHLVVFTVIHEPTGRDRLVTGRQAWMDSVGAKAGKWQGWTLLPSGVVSGRAGRFFRRAWWRR